MEMFQWKQEKHTKSQKDRVGGGTTKYTWWSFYQAWASTPLSNPDCSVGSSGGFTSTCCSKPSAQSGCQIDSCRSGMYQYPGSAVSGDVNPSTGACNPAATQWPDVPFANAGKQYAPAVRTGGFVLNQALIRKLHSKRYLTPAGVAAVTDVGAFPPPGATLPPQHLDTSTLRVSSLPVSTSSNGVERRGTSSTPVYAQTFRTTPRTGDVRMTWATNAATTVSVAAAVDSSGTTFVPWESPNAACSDSAFNELMEGTATHKQLVAAVMSSLGMMTWIIRLLTLVGMILGLAMCLNPLSVMPDIIPCIGPMIGDAVGCIIGTVAALVGAALWLVVTAL